MGAKVLWMALKTDSVILINLCCFKDVVLNTSHLKMQPESYSFTNPKRPKRQ